jgi:hypothetical protein
MIKPLSGDPDPPGGIPILRIAVALRGRCPTVQVHYGTHIREFLLCAVNCMVY